MDGLDELNKASSEEAFAALIRCCGSAKWAHNVSSQRPFQDVHELSVVSDHIWWSLGEEDWLEAFSAHPKIGEKTPSKSTGSDRWAKNEQSGTSGAANETLDALLKANHDYEKRFGYIYIVCATGKSAEEMLSQLKERMRNEPDTELRIAAEEQRRITHLRLHKLLSELE